MADNFDMKKFLVENQTGPYAKAKLTEGEAAYEYEKGKAAGEKEEKAKLTKEGDDEDKLPLTPKMKKFIDKSISDAKKDGDFEELVQVDYFENDFIEYILGEFDHEAEYDDVSQEVKNYINRSVKDYYRNPDGTPYFSEELNEDSDENYDIFMDGVLDVLVKDKLITKADVDALNRGGADDLMDALHDEWEGFKNYEETGQAISRSDLNLAARAVAKKIGKLKEEKEKLKEYEVIYVYGEDGKCYRKDDEGNYDQVDRSYCQRYAGSGVREEKEKVEETVDNRTLMTVEKIQDLLAKLKSNTATNSNIPTTDKQGLLDAFSYIEELLEDVGADIEIEMDDRYNKALEENAIRDSFLSPEAIDRMDGLVPQTALKALIGGAQAIIRDFKQEGFEDEEIFEFIMLKIKTLE